MDISFRNLREVIIKCCEANTNEPAFKLDTSKLENILKQKNSDLHVMGLNGLRIESFVPEVNQLQFLAEYTEDISKFQLIYNGRTQILPFMLFSKVDIDGPIEIKFNDDDENEITNKQLYKAFNNPKMINKDLAVSVMCTVPVYRVLVYRFLSNDNNRFTYSVLTRSNRPAINMYRAKYGKKPSTSRLVKRDMSANTKNKK